MQLRMRNSDWSSPAETAAHSMRIDTRQISLTLGTAVTVETKTGRRRLIDYFLAPVAQGSMRSSGNGSDVDSAACLAERQGQEFKERRMFFCVNRMGSDRRRHRSLFSTNRAVHTLLVAVLCLQSACSLAQTQYPPYPERWSWFPNRSTPAVGSSKLRWLPNGDVLVSYDLLGQNGEEEEDVSFFELRKFASVEAAFGEHIPGQQRRKVELPGKLLARTVSSSGCDRGLFSSVSLLAPDGKQIEKKAMVALLDQEIEYDELVCEGRDYPAFKSNVEIVTPVGILPLQDGTLLIASVGSGIVVRLDRQLRTREASANQRVIVMDAAELLTKHKEYFSGKEPTWKGFFEYLKREFF
jgi:hypothetical protein